jgi:hypothetical protein
MDSHVFICYARKDKDFVLQLAKKLKDQGVPVWLDLWDIPYGVNYRREIDRAISSCARMLLVLSPAAVDSEEVQSEWDKALNDGRVVIPLLHQTCEIPYRLRLIQRIDFTSRNIEDNIAFNDVLVALGMVESSLLKPAEITTPKVEMPVSANSVANENIIEGGSEVSNMQTLTEQAEVTAFGKPDVYIQDRKYSTIQEAVDAGNYGETITLVAGTYQENLLIEKPFTIKGAGEGKTIIDGCRGGSVIIVGKNRSNIDVTLFGMTIMGGTGTSVSVDDNDANKYICGGGILNYGRLTITDSIISGNTGHNLEI